MDNGWRNSGKIKRKYFTNRIQSRMKAFSSICPTFAIVLNGLLLQRLMPLEFHLTSFPLYNILFVAVDFWCSELESSVCVLCVCVNRMFANRKCGTYTVTMAAHTQLSRVIKIIIKSKQCAKIYINRKKNHHQPPQIWATKKIKKDNSEAEHR